MDKEFQEWLENDWFTSGETSWEEYYINRNSGALIMNKYDKDAVQKEIKKSGVSAKEASLIHKLLKGHQS